MAYRINWFTHIVAECRFASDAQFIAAAPQLFRALKTIIKRGYKIEVSDYETAVAALSAAKGE